MQENVYTNIYAKKESGRENTFLFMYICRDYVWKDTQEIDKIKLALERRSLSLRDQGQAEVMPEL